MQRIKTLTNTHSDPGNHQADRCKHGIMYFAFLDPFAAAHALKCDLRPLPWQFPEMNFLDELSSGRGPEPGLPCQLARLF